MGHAGPEILLVGQATQGVRVGTSYLLRPQRGCHKVCIIQLHARSGLLRTVIGCVGAASHSCWKTLSPKTLSTLKPAKLQTS